MTNQLKFHHKKLSIVLSVLLVIILLIAGSFLFSHSNQKQTEIFGKWICQTDPQTQMEITPNEIRINTFSFPYEFSLPIFPSPTRQQPQGFVLDAGSMGVLTGILFLENNDLHIEIDSEAKVFSRIDS